MWYNRDRNDAKVYKSVTFSWTDFCFSGAGRELPAASHAFVLHKILRPRFHGRISARIPSAANGPPQSAPADRMRYNVPERSRQAPEGHEAGFASALQKASGLLYRSRRNRRVRKTAQPSQFCPRQNRMRYNVLERSRQAPEGRKAGFAFASAKGFEVIILHPLYPSGYSRRPTATAVRASGPDAEQCSRREAEGFKRRTAPFLLLCKRLRGYYTTCQRKKQISAGRIHTFFTVYSRRYEPAGAGAYFSRKQLFPKGESP